MAACVKARMNRDFSIQFMTRKGGCQRLCGRPFGTACKIPPICFYSFFPSSRRDGLSIDSVVH